MKVTCSNAFAYEAIERLVYKVFNSKGHSSQCNAAYEPLVLFFLADSMATSNDGFLQRVSHLSKRYMKNKDSSTCYSCLRIKQQMTKHSFRRGR